MAKKKNSNRKHKFKYSEPVQETSVGGSVAQPVFKSATAGYGSQLAGNNYSYVTRDVKRLGIIAVFLVLLELSLWYILGNTPLGESIYSLIKV